MAAAAIALLSVTLGRYPIHLKELGGILLSKIVPMEPFWSKTQASLLLQHRLPRIALACMVGCCLSAAGAAYQGVFQNPMAAPDILGASSGAAEAAGPAAGDASVAGDASSGAAGAAGPAAGPDGALEAAGDGASSGIPYAGC